MTIRITYDSNDIDLLVDNAGLQPSPRQEVKRNISGSGQVEYVSIYGLQEITFSAVYKDAAHKLLEAWWWSSGRHGQQFAFAMDSSNTVYAMLDDSADSGQAVIPLAATTGISVNDEMVIINPGDNQREHITVQSISAGVSVTADSNLLSDYISGARLKHRYYFPGLITMDTKYRPKRTGAYYFNTFRWVEALEVASAILEDTDSAILE